VVPVLLAHLPGRHVAPAQGRCGWRRQGCARECGVSLDGVRHPYRAILRPCARRQETRVKDPAVPP